MLDEVKEILRKQYEAEGIRRTIRTTLESRFGPVPVERVAALERVADETRLEELTRLAATCPDLDTFVNAIAANG